LNFILIVTDDQRADTLWAMENLQSELLSRGVKFENGFATTPLCAPGRASILTGLYGHNTKILKNDSPFGGASEFNDKESLAVWLQRAGYRTALFGKYINGYGALSPYIPPGWDKWVAFVNTNYVDFSLNIDGNLVEFKDNYSTDLLFRESVNFIRENKERPFFIYLTPYASHGPVIPAKGDEQKFADFDFSPRPISYNEEDMSDKPSHLRNTPSLTEERQREIDEFDRNQLRTLQAVDRGIKAIFDELRSQNLLEKTVVIYTADNGFLWGEHRLTAKNRPYEESIRVPFAIYAPGIQGGRVDNSNLVLNIDIAPTILGLINIAKPRRNWEFDGKSLVDILKNPDLSLREEFFIEILGGTSCWGIRTREFKLVEYKTGDKEFYDLRTDPYELENQYNNPDYRNYIRELEQKLESEKRKMQPFVEGLRT